MKKNKLITARNYKLLLKEVELLAGLENWNPSFFPVGVFHDPDNVKYKLLDDEDRKGYMIEVVTRIILKKGDGGSKVE